MGQVEQSMGAVLMLNILLVGWQVEGNLIKWQKWQVRVSFNWREGLVLHNVGYEDEGRLRPIVHRASIAEMAVPYAEAQVLTLPAEMKILGYEGQVYIV